MMKFEAGKKARTVYISDENLLLALRVMGNISYEDILNCSGLDDELTKRSYKAFSELCRGLRSEFVDG